MDINNLLLERELNVVLSRYASACDQRDWSAMEDVFLEDATADYGGLQHLQGREPIVAMIRVHLDGCGPSQHLLGNLLVDASDAAVESRVYVRAAHRGAGSMRDITYESLAEYQDRWVSTVNGWRIAHRRMVISHEQGCRDILRPTTEAAHR
ncbi:nuclear transport factor 2 family protein [Pseudomonas sp. C32]|uniref:nuclear transport factor 2 family protein n=1 Tax=Pseudomonas sp. C32 TaxID=1529208 RepID=UPI00260FCA60|nr:nuclear transport factor 2 family protein [Pseudomonas sp. C32]MDN4544062.1 nuclear transport factor 2 family protein [Pseudomonas sp. C32]